MGAKRGGLRKHTAFFGGGRKRKKMRGEEEEKGERKSKDGDYAGSGFFLLSLQFHRIIIGVQLHSCCHQL